MSPSTVPRVQAATSRVKSRDTAFTLYETMRHIQYEYCRPAVSLFRNPGISYEGLHNHLTPVLLLRQEMGRTGMYSRYVVICLRGEFGGAMGEVGEVLAGDGELRGPIRPLYIL